MVSVTFTVPIFAMRPTSLRPRSISIRCSARSLGSARSSRSISRSFSGVAQLRAQLLQAAIRARIGPGLRRVRVDDEVDLSRQVVDDRELLGKQQADFRKSERIGFRLSAQPALDVAHGVVAEVAREAAGEAQARGEGGGAKRREVVVDVLQRIVERALLHEPAVARKRHAITRDLETLARGKPHDRVAPEALAADHRLEEVGAGPVRELEVDGKRRIEIGEGLELQRYSVGSGASERQEFVFSHESPRGYRFRKERQV